MIPRLVLCLAVLGQRQSNRIFGLGSLLGGGSTSITIGGNRPVGGNFGGNFGVGFNSGGGCSYWCQTPSRQYYCCEQPGQSLGGGGGFGNKPGQCPPVRPQCPPTRGFRPPQVCQSDNRCPGREKCCYDTCLRHRTCKPPNGGFFG